MIRIWIIGNGTQLLQNKLLLLYSPLFDLNAFTLIISNNFFSVSLGKTTCNNWHSYLCPTPKLGQKHQQQL